MTTATGKKTVTVRLAEDRDLAQLIPVVRASHEKMGRPFGAEYSPERTLELLAIVTVFPTTALLLAFDGRVIVGYCWAEQFVDVRELHLHEVYLRAGYDIEPLWLALVEEARMRGCVRMTAVSFRDGSVPLFSRRGFRPVGTYMIREVS